MSGLSIPKLECVDRKENYGRFVAQPLEKGFGITLGNSLRRVLLAYLQGAAITRVRIDGIQHEFSTIPHIKEDTLEFLLNIKAIRLKSLSGQPGVLLLEAEGTGEVFAADIKPSTDFEIVNPDIYLATLDSSEARLRVELEVEMGTGFRQAGSTAHLPVGTIPLDAVFTPVRRVNFAVTPTHIGQETSLEQLTLEIWTDGTITPDEALGNAAGILMEQLGPFMEFPGLTFAKPQETAVHPAIPDEKFNMPVEQLDLSVRTMNCLRRAGITTVGELLSREEKELMSLRNFGTKSKQELKERLAALGLSLTGQTEEGAETTEPETEEGEAGDEPEPAKTEQ